ncbi:MAG: trypsin-like peptidase domain-containing protein [Pseudomonadota bacterium]|nr:trypsin-like peptidase domain-containing protein [Pseudomonadota bacterium]
MFAGVCALHARTPATSLATAVLLAIAAAFALLHPLTGFAGSTVPIGYAALVQRVAPSVVTVMVEEQSVGAGQRAAARANPEPAGAVSELIRRLLAGAGGTPGPEEGSSAVLGSGFVIRADGLIVTNRHVIVGARIIRVRLTDSREVAATLVGADAVTDIALLKVNAGRLPVLRLGSSNAVAVGDAVIAIGNPFGLGQSVSAGIVSARARTLEDDPYIDFLQTDAAINRGNSGGPLLALDGTVVGVTSAIFSPSGGSVGLGFAIPAETVSSIIGQLEARGHVERGYLGISAQGMTPILAKALGMKKSTGALVTSVDGQGPAVGALFVGDVLLKLGSSPVTFKDLSKITARLAPQALVVATVLRAGGQQSVGLTIGRLPDPPADPALTGDQDTWVAGLGLGLANTTPDIRRAIKANDDMSGLIVTQLRPAGAGALAGLKVGDLITHAGTKQLIDVVDIAKVARPTPEAPLLIRVVRDGNPRFIAITGEAELQFP